MRFLRTFSLSPLALSLLFNACLVVGYIFLSQGLALLFVPLCVLFFLTLWMRGQFAQPTNDSSSVHLMQQLALSSTFSEATQILLMELCRLQNAEGRLYHVDESCRLVGTAEYQDGRWLFSQRNEIHSIENSLLIETKQVSGRQMIHIPILVRNELALVIQLYPKGNETLKENVHELLLSVVPQVQQIIERKRRADHLKKHREKLTEASKMAALGQMAGGIAHEINTPLSILSGRASQIRRLSKKPNAKTLSEIADSLTETIDRITQTIESMRSFSRDSQNTSKEETTLEAILEDTLPLVRDKFHQNQVILHIGPIPDVRLICRPIQISQILLNLLSNAHHAVQQSASPEVRIQCAENNGRLRISVIDNGPGIPENLRDKILEPLFTTKAAGEGTGLGLSISQRLAEQHDGQLRLQDSATGTHFLLELPLLSTKSRAA